MTKYDAIVIGAGHNGLIAASYLAKAGHSVIVLDGRASPGGCASSKTMGEGFTVSDCAQWITQLDPQVVSDLKLGQHGLSLGEAKATIALQADGDHLMIKGDQVSGAGITSTDQAALRTFKSQIQTFTALMNKAYQARAPKLVDHNWTDRITLMKLGLGLKLMGRANMQDLMRIIMINIYDVMNEHFDHEGLKGALALDAITGTNMGPRSPNTVFSYLHRAMGEQFGIKGPQQVIGGMGQLGMALAQAAQSLGATIQLGTAVTSINKTDDRVTGVTLDTGESLAAKVVLSSADPKTTFRDLVGYQHIETGMARRVEHFRTRSGTAKLHLTLSGLPSFNGLADDDLSERLVIAPSMDAIESAFNPMKYAECGPSQVFDISIPTVEDPSLAPNGQHQLTALVHYLPYAPTEGWDALRPKVLDQLIEQLGSYAPSLRQQIMTSELLTPADFEASHGMSGGNWHHGELAIDQALMMRPFPGSTQYQTALPGLYLCGAGAHPGGSLMGLPGKNAANELLKQGDLA